MPLEHVSKWDNTHGWVRTTPSEAIQLYRYGLSSWSKQFMCELCGQYTSFVVGEYHPHFKHPIGSKDCVEKSTTYSNYYKTNPLGFSLPLRIKIDSDCIEIFIGFSPLTEVDMEKAKRSNAYVTVSLKNGQEIRRFSIDTDRFSSEHITYLSVGNAFSEQYLLNYSVVNKYYWPHIVDGFSSKGTLFDEATGKRLPRNANVEVGRNYLILAKQHIFRVSDIVLQEERAVSDWKVYRVSAACISRNAADFFLQYGGRLTDKSVNITHLWPPAVQSSHVLIYCGVKTYFYNTDGCIEVYPTNTYVNNSRNGTLFSVGGGFQQILTVSRFENHTSVLRYTMLRPVQHIDRIYRPSGVTIQNKNGETIEQGTQTVMPPGNSIYVSTDYDGFIEIIKNDFVVNHIPIKGGEKQKIDVEINRVYRIYQGLDQTAEISFIRLQKSWKKNDVETLKTLIGFKGQETSVPHTFGAIASKMLDMPQTKMWLQKQLRQGVMDKQALTWLKMNFGRAK